LDLVVMIAALGYIFMTYIKSPNTEYNVITGRRGFNWEDFRFAALVTAPGIVLHELGHKFVALLLGLTAEFHASYFGLFLGIFLKLIASPFIIFAPGFVRISAATDPQLFLTAFSGPFMNLVLFGIAALILNRKKMLTRSQAIILHLTKKINLFLFFFNLIPIPPFDGFTIFSSLFRIIF